MITVRLMGGLSNQMFQYAAARALASRHDTGVRLDLSWFDSIAEVDTPRYYELDCFKFEKHILTSNILTKYYHKFFPGKIYREKGLGFNKQLFSQPDNTTLIGYFQTEKYYKDIASTILQDFTWSQPATGKNAALLQRIKRDASSVSVHIRRGDYVTNKHAKTFHGVLGVDYYKRALEYISKTVKQPHVYVFSNDPEWCKQHLKLQYPTVFVDHNDDITSGPEDMRLMKTCRHNVIANSSMSWWGAWLNQNPDKIVVAPDRWFADTKQNTKDIIPDAWHKVRST